MAEFNIAPVGGSEMDPEGPPYVLPGEGQRTILSVTRTRYRDSGGGFCEKIRAYILKRKSSGPQILEHEMENIGADEVIEGLNLGDLKPGYYLLNTTFHKDWETQMVDYWDHELVPWCPSCEKTFPKKDQWNGHYVSPYYADCPDCRERKTAERRKRRGQA